MILENIISKPREEISVSYEPDTEAIWIYFNPQGRYCCNLKLLQEIHELQLDIQRYFVKSKMKPKTSVKYIVSASKSNGVYSYGGDLNLFSKLITKNKKNYLKTYAEACIKCVYFHAISLNLPITTISLVEGTALGGGFEAAIAGNVLIAEKGTKLGFPEIRFNLFPGMGAYSLIARKTNIKTAEKLISSGCIHLAEELYDLDIVDILAESGDGIQATRNYMKRNAKQFIGKQGIIGARLRYQPIDYSELIDIADIWVESALKLTPKDLKMMNKLVSMQNTKTTDNEDDQVKSKIA